MFLAQRDSLSGGVVSNVGVAVAALSLPAAATATEADAVEK